VVLQGQRDALDAPAVARAAVVGGEELGDVGVTPRTSSSAISSKFRVVIAPINGTWCSSPRTSSIDAARSAPP